MFVYPGFYPGLCLSRSPPPCGAQGPRAQAQGGSGAGVKPLSGADTEPRPSVRAITGGTRPPPLSPTPPGPHPAALTGCPGRRGRPGRSAALLPPPQPLTAPALLGPSLSPSGPPSAPAEGRAAPPGRDRARKEAGPGRAGRSGGRGDEGAAGGRGEGERGWHTAGLLLWPHPQLLSSVFCCRALPAGEFLPCSLPSLSRARSSSAGLQGPALAPHEHPRAALGKYKNTRCYFKLLFPCSIPHCYVLVLVSISFFFFFSQHGHPSVRQGVLQLDRWTKGNYLRPREFFFLNRGREVLFEHCRSRSSCCAVSQGWVRREGWDLSLPWSIPAGPSAHTAPVPLLRKL